MALIPSQFIFILVEPAVAENVGASARALRTMGFERLAVVNSMVHRKPEARWLAHGSAGILDSVEEFASLEEAVKGSDLVIGTSAKKRRVHSDYYQCYDLPALVDRKAPIVEKISLVFGREESGLTNEEMGLCNVFTGIPMHAGYPSLNLAQAVMIYAWELFRYSYGISGVGGMGDMGAGHKSASDKLKEPSSATGTSSPGANDPSEFKLNHLRNSVRSLMSRAGFKNRDPLYNRIMERFEALDNKDAGLVLSLCTKIGEALDRSDGKRLPGENLKDGNDNQERQEEG